ncbi:MAG: MBOAT family O-acyltransferase [Solirubrobacteraceae bacterium]
MLFPSVQFAIFFPIVLAVSWALMSRPKLWKPFILIASYVFYAAASPTFCLLLGGVTAGNYAAARLIGSARSERAKRWICGVAVAGDLATLGAFKYYSFFAQAIARSLNQVSLGMPLPLLTIALPVGISFFTFQAISYTVDVKRGLIEPARFLDTAIYLSFFPHLVAGPIVRAREFLPQLAKPADPDRVAVSSGLMLIGMGLVKKVVIADYLGRAIVDPVFGVPQAFHGPDVLLAGYAYAAQIYCDFSGYTDIAIGLALLMGFVFPQNFRSPYRSLGLSEFWRRWHMTLSRFLRDFLYIPLGGNRKGRLMTYRNLMITMVLGGLWHGAAWTFVIWGTFHGVGLCFEHAWRKAFKWRPPAWAKWVITFHFVVLGWVFFRAQGIGLAWSFIKQLGSWGAPTLYTAPVLLAIGVAIIPQLLPPRPVLGLQDRLGRVNPAVLGGALAVLILFAAATVPSQGVPPFIYFRF